jgi:UDP-glucose 4-epimerase
VPNLPRLAGRSTGGTVLVSRTILVTGATGFIGAHVVRRLLASGAEVAGISLGGGQVSEVQVTALDLCDRDRAMEVLKRSRCDAVVHLAAALPNGNSAQEMQVSFDRTVLSAATITAFCRETGCQLVYASGSSVYGSMTEDTPVSEDRLPAPETLYTAAKYVGDILSLQLSNESGAPAAVLRISAPYGPGSRRPTVVETFLRAALSSTDLSLLGTGSRTQDFTFIDDVVDAVECALTTRASGVFNIGTGRPVSMRALAETVLEVVPESTSRIVSSGSADPQETYRAFMNVSRAREELGWAARVPLPAGLRATVEGLEGAR